MDTNAEEHSWGAMTRSPSRSPNQFRRELNGSLTALSLERPLQHTGLDESKETARVENSASIARCEPVKVLACTVTYQTDLDHIRNLGRSLMTAVEHASQDMAMEFEFKIVVNDTDRDCIEGVQKVVANLEMEFGERIYLATGHGNVGYGSAHNLAMATGFDYVLVLNPDVELAPSSLLNGIRYLEENHSVVMAVPQAYDSGGRYAYLAKRKPSLVVLLLRMLAVSPSYGLPGRLVNRYVYGDMLPAERPVSVEHASGCFMLCRAEPFRAIGGFDERYFLYFEDYDLSHRIRKHGDIHELPDLNIVHYGGNASRSGLRRMWFFFKSTIRFFNTYGWRLF